MGRGQHWRPVMCLGHMVFIHQLHTLSASRGWWCSGWFYILSLKSVHGSRSLIGGGGVERDINS